MVAPDGIPLSYASPTLRPLKPDIPTRQWRRIACLLFLAFLSLTIFIFLPRTGETGSSPKQVFILRPAIQYSLPLLALAGVCLGAIATAMFLRYRRALIGSIVLTLTVLGGIIATGAYVAHSLGPWIIYDEVTVADGQQYCFIDSSFLQGQTMAIARRDPTGLLYQSLYVMGTTNGDSPRSYLRITIPSPKPIPYGALYATSGGLLVGVRQGNDCYMVYDITTKTFFGHGDVEKLSPNLLAAP